MQEVTQDLAVIVFSCDFFIILSWPTQFLTVFLFRTEVPFSPDHPLEK